MRNKNYKDLRFRGWESELRCCGVVVEAAVVRPHLRFKCIVWVAIMELNLSYHNGYMYELT